jgi:protein-disulfide isomerase
MRLRHLVLVLRLSLLVAIAASAAMRVDYQNAGDPAFCGVTSGCFAVRLSDVGRQIGGVLPTLGLVAHAALLAGSLLARTPRLHRVVAGLAVLGGLIGTALLGIQAFSVGAFCAWCTAVDLASITAAGAAVLIAWQARREEEAREGGAVLLTWVLAAFAAIGLPQIWGKYPVIPDLPPEIASLQVPGKVTIVGFTDFECPFCRKLHPELHRIEQQLGDRVHVVRKMMPLPGHPGALPAARAYVCTPPAQREAAADQLYAAESEQLTDKGVAAVLAPLGLDRNAVDACLAAPETQAAIDADVALYKRLAGMGLPFTFVGRRVVLGYNPSRIEEAARLEAAGPQLGLPLWGLFGALGGVAVAAAVISLRRRDSAFAGPFPAGRSGARMPHA